MAKNKPAAVAEAEDDEIETLEESDEEEATAEEATPKKRARKAKKEKEEREGLTTKEAAALLDITPVKLRRILRTDDFFNDKGYTRYLLTDEEVERLRAAIAAGTTTERKPRGKKKAKAAEVEAAEEVAEELESLDDLEEAEADEEEEE